MHKKYKNGTSSKTYNVQTGQPLLRSTTTTTTTPNNTNTNVTKQRHENNNKKYFATSILPHHTTPMSKQRVAFLDGTKTRKHPTTKAGMYTCTALCTLEIAVPKDTETVAGQRLLVRHDLGLQLRGHGHHAAAEEHLGAAVDDALGGALHHHEALAVRLVLLLHDVHLVRPGRNKAQKKGHVEGAKSGRLACSKSGL